MNYKHVIVIYGTVIVDLPQIADSSLKNPSHDSTVAPPFNTNVPNANILKSGP